MEEKKQIHIICATRPNFVKVVPLYHVIVLHTGQHYDLNMSDVFFSDPHPDPQNRYERWQH